MLICCVLTTFALPINEIDLCQVRLIFTFGHWRFGMESRRSNTYVTQFYILAYLHKLFIFLWFFLFESWVTHIGNQKIYSNWYHHFGNWVKLVSKHGENLFSHIFSLWLIFLWILLLKSWVTHIGNQKIYSNWYHQFGNCVKLVSKHGENLFSHFLTTIHVSIDIISKIMSNSHRQSENIFKLIPPFW